jgi:hypothetical protein
LICTDSFFINGFLGDARTKTKTRISGDFETIVIPINSHHHWNFAVVRPQKGTAEFFDTLFEPIRIDQEAFKSMLNVRVSEKPWRLFQRECISQESVLTYINETSSDTSAKQKIKRFRKGDITRKRGSL